MAASLLVRRSTARLPCLVRCQVANIYLGVKLPPVPSAASRPAPPSGRRFFGERELPAAALPLQPRLASDPVASMPVDKAHSEFKKYCMKYNPLKGPSINEILDNDKEWQNFFLPTKRCMAASLFCSYQDTLRSFRRHMIPILFEEHLVKHCSHTMIQIDEAWKFKKLFNLPSVKLLEGVVEEYYHHSIEYRDKELPQEYKDLLFRAIEERKEQVRNSYREQITDEVIRETEEDILETIDLKIVARAGSTTFRCQYW